MQLEGAAKIVIALNAKIVIVTMDKYGRRLSENVANCLLWEMQPKGVVKLFIVGNASKGHGKIFHGGKYNKGLAKFDSSNLFKNTFLIILNNPDKKV